MGRATKPAKARAQHSPPAPSRTPATRGPLADLPAELLAEIASHVEDADDYRAFCLTCRAWNQAARDYGGGGDNSDTDSSSRTAQRFGSQAYQQLAPLLRFSHYPLYRVRERVNRRGQLHGATRFTLPVLHGVAPGSAEASLHVRAHFACGVLHGVLHCELLGQSIVLASHSGCAGFELRTCNYTKMTLTDGRRVLTLSAAAELGIPVPLAELHTPEDALTALAHLARTEAGVWAEVRSWLPHEHEVWNAALERVLQETEAEAPAFQAPATPRLKLSRASYYDDYDSDADDDDDDDDD